MADLKWGLTEVGIEGFGDNPETWLGFLQDSIREGIVNGVPLVDVLEWGAKRVEDTLPTVPQRSEHFNHKEHLLTAAALRVLAGRE